MIASFPHGAVVKNLPANLGDAENGDLISGSGRPHGVENSNLLQYSCLENSMDREAWRATVHGVTKELDTTEQLTLSLHTFTSEFLFKKSL